MLPVEDIPKNVFGYIISLTRLSNRVDRTKTVVKENRRQLTKMKPGGSRGPNMETSRQ